MAGRAVADAPDWAKSLSVQAALVPEPTNLHDVNAVRVELATGDQWVLVGHLSAAVNAPAYQPTLTRLVGQGDLPTVVARVCRPSDGGPLAVYLHLSPADSCVMANRPPAGSTLLAADREAAVTGEQHHQAELQPYAPAANQTSTPVWVTLHPGQVPSGKYAEQETIEVRLDGLVVGTLSGPQGQKHLHHLGSPSTAEGAVFHGAHGLEARIFLPAN